MRRYHQDRSAERTILPRTLFKMIGEAFVQSLQAGGHAVTAVSVNPTHAHALVELPYSVAIVKRACGWCKFFAARAIREVAPVFRDREIWAGGETYEPVDHPAHLRAAHNYILHKRGRDAWSWSLDGGAKW